MKNNTQDLSKDNNINSGDKKQPNCNDKSAKRKEFDVFISYRHLDTKKTEKNPDHKHTTSLAWSIYQALESKGFHVFFDCAYNLEDTIPAIDKCRYFIILITQDSIDAIKTYSFEKIKTMLENNERGDGFNYVKELYEIENRINQEPIDEKKTIAIDKKNVFLLNIDDRHTGTDISDILKGQHYNKLGEIISTPFETDQRFKASIDGLIKPNNGSGNRLRKKVQFFNKEIPWPRFGNEICKKLSWCAIILIPFFFIAVGYFLYQCFSKPVVFAGGGTVQNYISKKYRKDVNTYRNWLGWKYIHIPSEDAWSLLWDDFTEVDKNRHYWPIVLSAEKISDSIREQKKQLQDAEVVGYEVGTAFLQVQIIINKADSTYKRQNSVGLEELCEWLKNESYVVHTTTEHSATYNAYKKLLLDRKFNLDSLIQKQGRKDFTLKDYEEDSNKNHIFLANSLYYYTLGKPDISLLQTKTQDTITMPLFVYTVARKLAGTKECELCPQVEKFFRSIECNTDTTITFQSDKITMLKRRK